MSEDAGEARIREIARLFEKQGWKFRLVVGEDGGWEALFGLRYIGSFAQRAQGLTRLAAAEAAWTKYQREPPLGRTAAGSGSRDPRR